MLTQLYYITSEDYDAFIVSENIQDAIRCWKLQQIDIEGLDEPAIDTELSRIGEPENIAILTSTCPLIFSKPIFRMMEFG